MKAAEIDTITLLRDVGWAQSNGEARRMILGGGLYIDGEKHDFIEPFFFTGSSFIMNFGRRRYVRVHILQLKDEYPD